MLKILLLSFGFFASQNLTQASSKKDSALIENYLNFQRDAFKKICPANIDKHAENLYKSYLGDGLYIPFLSNGNLDAKTIADHISLLEKKVAWIKSINAELLKKKNFKFEYGQVKAIREDLSSLGRIYHQYYLANNFDEKKKLVIKSREETQRFVSSLINFLEKNNYMHTFQFPLDHFYLRTEYDKYKDLQTEEGRQKTNQIYFLRKLVEEGAVDREKGRTDLFVRALINSVFMRINSHKEAFLDNSLIYDIEALLKNYEDTYLDGLPKFKLKMKHWEEKAYKDFNYYSDLLVKQNNKDELLTKIFQDKNKARYALSDYVYQKEAEVYKYWSAKEAIFQKLFALETILFHEVGRLDDNYGTERSDVLRVVMNRYKINEYANLLENEPISQKLSSIGIKDTKKFPWLNILFKQGEFSFTYFFIPASRGIFCADQSKTATKLRRQNLHLALKVLEEKNSTFQATRYFSRASMLGRIDMAKLWIDYSSIGERPGPRIVRDAKLKQHLKNSTYTYLYNFTYENIVYEVLRMKNQDFVYSPKLSQFFNYRNPHHFNYFIKNRPY